MGGTRGECCLEQQGLWTCAMQHRHTQEESSPEGAFLTTPRMNCPGFDESALNKQERKGEGCVGTPSPLVLAM